MKLDVRFRKSSAATACVLQALAWIPSSQSQYAPAATQQVQSAPAAPQAPGPAFKEDWTSQISAYDSLINRIAGEDYQKKRDSELDKQPVHKMTDFCKILGLREDEQQAVYTILVDADARIKEANRRYNARLGELRQTPHPEKDAEVNQWWWQRPTIIEETISKLRGELGSDDFKRLDKWVYDTSRLGKVIPLTPPAPGKHESSVHAASTFPPRREVLLAAVGMSILSTPTTTEH